MPDIKRYARLKALLQEKITSGAYEPGDRFFSQNELMRKYELSFSTVIRALDELVTDGYLVRKQGKGTYVARTAPIVGAQQAEEKQITIFAPWESSTANSFGQVQFPLFYRHLSALKPGWMHLRVVPITPEPEAIEPWLFSKEVTHAALALYPSPDQMPILQKMTDQHPVVAITGERPITGITSIVTSFAEAGALATRHLIGEGHTAIPVILPSSQTAATAACLQGYRHGLRDASYPFAEALITTCKPSDPTGYHAMLHLFDTNSSVKIGSVIVVGGEMLPGILYAAEAMQRAAPDKLSAVCIDGQLTQKFAAKAARVIFPVENLAETALNCLAAAILNTTPQAVTVSAQLIPATPHQGT